MTLWHKQYDPAGRWLPWFCPALAVGGAVIERVCGMSVYVGHASNGLSCGISGYVGTHMQGCSQYLCSSVTSIHVCLAVATVYEVR